MMVENHKYTRIALYCISSSFILCAETNTLFGTQQVVAQGCVISVYLVIQVLLCAATSADHDIVDGVEYITGNMSTGVLSYHERDTLSLER